MLTICMPPTCLCHAFPPEFALLKNRVRWLLQAKLIEVTMKLRNLYLVVKDLLRIVFLLCQILTIAAKVAYWLIG